MRMRREARGGPRRWVTALGIALGAIVVLAILVRALLDPVATRFTRRALEQNEAVRGAFSSVHVTLLPPGYEIRHLKLIEHPGGDWERPLLYAERARIAVVWR